MAEETAVQQFQKAALDAIEAMSGAAAAMIGLIDVPAAGSSMDDDYKAFKAKGGTASEKWAEMLKTVSTAWTKPEAPASGGVEKELPGPAKAALSKNLQVDGINNPNPNPAIPTNANPPVLWPPAGPPLALTFVTWVDADSCLVNFAATVPDEPIPPIPFGYTDANGELKTLGVVKIIKSA